MNSWQFTSFAIFYIIAALVAFALSFYVWNMKYISGNKFFRYLTLFSGIWTLAYILYFFSTDIGLKLIMLRIEYLGIIGADLFWLFFVVSYANSERWLTKWMYVLISLIPFLTFIQVLFFPYHEFFYVSFDFVQQDGLLISQKTYGPGFYIWVAYSYLVLIAGGVILIRGIANMPIRFRRQTVAIIITLIIIIVPNFFYIIGINPIAPYDPTSLSFVIVGLLFFLIIYFDKFLKIVPVAYNLVFRSSKSGVIVINNDGVILDINPSAEKIFDLKQEDTIGSNVLNYLSDFEDVYQNLLNDQEYHGELNFVNKNCFYELISSSIKDYKKRIVGRILVFYDITKRKQALFELDAYARTVAHDLKSPMSAVNGFVQLLNESENLNKDEQMYCHYIYDGINKMTDIIDGLLLLAQVRNKKDIEFQPIYTGILLDKIINRVDNLVKKHKGKIEMADDWPYVNGYPIWVEEIWVNYISNALKYGGDPPSVELGYTELKDSVKFWVKDNGIGISEDEQKELFKEFSQLETRKNNTQGYGLGLSLVKRMTQKMGGDIGVESKLGNGSTFFFSLPKNNL